MGDEAAYPLPQAYLGLVLSEHQGRWTWRLAEFDAGAEPRWLDGGPAYKSFEEAWNNGPPSQWRATGLVYYGERHDGQFTSTALGLGRS